MSEIIEPVLVSDEEAKKADPDSASFEIDMSQLPKILNIRPDVVNIANGASLSAELDYDLENMQENCVVVDLENERKKKIIPPIERFKRLAWLSFFMEDNFQKMYAMMGYKHAERNLKVAHNDLHDLREKHSGQKCVIVSAGPSLLRCVDKFRALPPEVRIIAVDRAVPVLLDAGARIDYAVNSDPVKGPLWGSHDVSGIPLICSLVSNADFISAWSGPRYFFLDQFSHATMYAMASISRLKSVLVYAGNVATCAFSAARYMGFSNVAFVAHDYGVKVDECPTCKHKTTGRTHADTDSPESFKKSGDMSEVRGLDGLYRVPRSLMYQKLWTEATVERMHDTIYFNWSDGGCLGVDQDTGDILPSIPHVPFGMFEVP
jgi:hypothetical protein